MCMYISRVHFTTLQIAKQNGATITYIKSSRGDRGVFWASGRSKSDEADNVISLKSLFFDDSGVKRS